MAAEIAAMLDELMGRDRDMLPDEKHNLPKFSDPDVCKHYLLGMCPHDLFINTRSDLGKCSFRHDDIMKKQWEDEPDKEKYPYEYELTQYCERLIDLLDKKIAQKRQKQAEQVRGTVVREVAKLHLLVARGEDTGTVSRLAAIDVEIEHLAKQIEDLGEEGLIEQATEAMAKMEALKKERESLVSKNDKLRLVNHDQAMRVCDACGCVIPVDDDAKLYQNHAEGKQHIGYLRMREFVTKYYSTHPRGPPPSVRGPPRDDRRDDRRRDFRDRDRDRGRDTRYERDRRSYSGRDYDRRGRDSYRERDRDREYRDRERDRESDRDRDYRDRDRDYRDRERDNRGKERDGDRSPRNSDRRDPPDDPTETKRARFE